MTPPSTRLSPIMVERRGWSRFATLDVDLEALKGAAKSCGATVNDAFLAAAGYGMASYHHKHGAPVERLRAAVAVNTRRPGDSPYGNHARGGSLVIPAGADDPATCMRACHDAVALLRDDVRQPLTGAVVMLMSLLGPFVTGFAGAIMKNCDFAVSNVPGVDIPLFLAGAEVLAIYGFGPTMGTAANIALVSYRDTAFIGCHVDAAAVPDVDMLVECLRLGFDAVLAVNA